MRMENEEFGILMDEVLSSKYMEKVKEVEAFGFGQKTEKLSMLLNIIESCDNEKLNELLFMVIVGGQVKREKLGDLMLRSFASDDYL